MEQRSSRVVVAELIDPVAEELERELTSREWIVEPDDAAGQAFKIKSLGETEEDAQGQALKYKLRPAEDDAEGHAFKRGLGTPRTTSRESGRWTIALSDDQDDTKGQYARVKFLGETEEDVEGQGLRIRYMKPEGDEDTEGQGLKARFFIPDGDDTEGQALRIRFIRRGEEEDDVEGHPYKRLGNAEGDVGGQVYRVPPPRPGGEGGGSD